MRTTLVIDDDLMEKASKLTHIKSKTALIHEGLKALIIRESSQRLALLGGTEKNLKDVIRRPA
ncbi:MAG: type II toxin-antitoxin system VapB family antitoxin [Leptospirales bacterium]